MLAQVLSPDGSVVVSGLTIQLTCVATAGDLPISFTWSGGGIVTHNTSTDTGSTISITLAMSSDYGTYICRANNVFGSVSDVINIIRAGMMDNKYCCKL